MQAYGHQCHSINAMAVAICAKMCPRIGREACLGCTHVYTNFLAFASFSFLSLPPPLPAPLPSRLISTRVFSPLSPRTHAHTLAAVLFLVIADLLLLPSAGKSPSQGKFPSIAFEAGPLTDWCIQYGKTPGLWVCTASAWWVRRCDVTG